MDGRALTVSELAHAAGVTIQTASGHLSNLDAARLLVAEKQGRHRYFRLSGPDVAQVLDALMGLAQRTGAVRVRTGPRDPALKMARVCSHPLAGERVARLPAGLPRPDLLAVCGPPVLTAPGRPFFDPLRVATPALERGAA